MRLTDVDALEKGKYHSIEFGTQAAWKQGWNDAIDAIINYAETVDAVPVVRCKDCIHRMKNGMCECKNYSVVAQDDNDFCSWGERRENGKIN